MAAGPAQNRGLPVVGHTLGGKYEIVSLLGEGGMASVFEASHKRLHQKVAIKILSPELASDAELVARFEREARAMGKLTSRHVVRVTDVEETADGLPFMVMELLTGRDLDAELQQRQSLPLGESIDIVLQACSGMHEAHGAGIVHRDLKPANIFLSVDRETNERIVKILDFGISKIAGEASRLTGIGAVMGTVLYMSPEQVKAESNVDVRADVWSIGVMLYELLAGRAPFEGSSPQIASQIVTMDAPEIRTFAPSVPEGVALSLRRMLERDRARRFPTLSDVILALAPFAPPGSIGASIGAKHSFSTSSSGKTVALSMKRTVPMSGAQFDRPSSQSISPGRLIPTSPPPAHRSSSQNIAPPAVATGSTEAIEPKGHGRPLFILAMLVGFLGAAGVVLIVLAIAKRSSTPSPPAPAATTSARQGVAP